MLLPSSENYGLDRNSAAYTLCVLLSCPSDEASPIPPRHHAALQWVRAPSTWQHRREQWAFWFRELLPNQSGQGDWDGGKETSTEFIWEESCSHSLNGIHHKCPIQKFVTTFAGSLCNQQTAMAGRPVQEAFFLHIVRLMLSANGVIWTKLPEFECSR